MMVIFWYGLTIYSLNVSILLSSIAPPTIPPLASKLDPPSPTPIYMFLCPVLPIDRRPSDLKSLVSHLCKWNNKVCACMDNLCVHNYYTLCWRIMSASSLWVQGECQIIFWKNGNNLPSDMVPHSRKPQLW
jgi:hypothetical protein